MSDGIRIAVVAGEESGDLLAADLINALKSRSGQAVDLVGVGGTHLTKQGLESLFDPAEIALMGISAVVSRLPSLIRRIGQTADFIVKSQPDLLLIVDSPDFTHRVARKVRATLPDIPIVNYVCPSVWAWRSGRAKVMRDYVDHVLCLLPFEPDALARLGGPSATYVGHRLTSDKGLLAAWQIQQGRQLRPTSQRKPVLCLLPGSRRSEVKGLLPFFGDTLGELQKLEFEPELYLPTVPHVEPLVRDLTRDWPRKPEIILGEELRYDVFSRCDAALAASGTVTLELALAGVPLVSCYKTDVMARALRSFITSWSVSLPNLVAERPVVPEIYDVLLRANYVARHLAGLLEDSPSRSAQMKGFVAIRNKFSTDKPAGELAADAVMKLVKR